ncbi:YqgE/AlgH family protein [Zooshikella ganghwensis]|uniref:YqgE/AlgH family protein n=1 Tax=Zooshikella ganghwensis TaxID=202772 RepID=UPI00041CBC69|nr:YqgE/AlgH family protein [Zooshikella ganghwensis]
MNTSSTQSFKDHFLIAMPHLKDPNFADSVTYICEHNDQGAMGIVINRPTGLTLDEIFRQVGITPSHGNAHISDIICAGGPVELERGFVLHSPSESHWEATLQVAPGVQLTTSKDILLAIAQNEGPENALIALGYSGWDKGQLEQEILDNSWLVCKADPNILFNTPIGDRLNAAVAALGINRSMLSPVAGHA